MVFAPGLLDPYMEAFGRIRQAYPWTQQHISSHNDPNPATSSRRERLCLVDWETAYRTDPLTDIAP
jgi:thiamine kinase-like enzyme